MGVIPICLSTSFHVANQRTIILIGHTPNVRPSNIIHLQIFPKTKKYGSKKPSNKEDEEVTAKLLGIGNSRRIAVGGSRKRP